MSKSGRFHSLTILLPITLRRNQNICQSHFLFIHQINSPTNVIRRTIFQHYRNGDILNYINRQILLHSYFFFVVALAVAFFAGAFVVVVFAAAAFVVFVALAFGALGSSSDRKSVV